MVEEKTELIERLEHALSHLKGKVTIINILTAQVILERVVQELKEEKK